MEEARFQASLPTHAQKALNGKPVLLRRKLLDESGYPDPGVKFLMEGVEMPTWCRAGTSCMILFERRLFGMSPWEKCKKDT